MNDSISSIFIKSLPCCPIKIFHTKMSWGYACRRAGRVPHRPSHGINRRYRNSLLLAGPGSQATGWPSVGPCDSPYLTGRTLPHQRLNRIVNPMVQVAGSRPALSIFGYLPDGPQSFISTQAMAGVHPVILIT